jgi:hypothetical protein
MKKARLQGYSFKEQIALFASFERLNGLIASWKNNGEYEKFDDFLLAVADEKTEEQSFKRFEKLLFKEWSSAIRKHIKSYRERGSAQPYDEYLLAINERHEKNNIRRKEKK